MFEEELLVEVGSENAFDMEDAELLGNEGADFLGEFREDGGGFHVGCYGREIYAFAGDVFVFQSEVFVRYLKETTRGRETYNSAPSGGSNPSPRAFMPPLVGTVCFNCSRYLLR